MELFERLWELSFWEKFADFHGSLAMFSLVLYGAAIVLYFVVLENHELLVWFKNVLFVLFLDLLISRDNLVNGRPSSDGIKKIMSYFDVRNTRLILKIDDTPLGITEGVNANVWTCGITKFSTLLNVLPNDLVIKPRNIKEVTERLYKEGADYVVSDISEIPKVIESINTRLKY